MHSCEAADPAGTVVPGTAFVVVTTAFVTIGPAGTLYFGELPQPHAAAPAIAKATALRILAAFRSLAAVFTAERSAPTPFASR